MSETLKLCLHITRRNWTVYKKDLIANLSPTIADPVFFILSLGLGLGSYIAQLNGRSYLTYIAPGLVVSTALMTSFFECSYGFFVRKTFENIFTALLTTPVGVTEIILGEFIWVALKGIAMSLGVALVFACFGLVSNLVLFPLIGVVGALVALSCGAMGLLASSKVRNINQFQTVYSFLISPLFFFSGIFFPLSQMPIGLRYFVYLLPLSHGVHLTQAIFWNEGLAEAWLIHGSVLVVQSAVLCTLAFRAVSKLLKQ